ncbi:hypothetical protein WB401_07980 [Streptomyces brasiliscabiei]|uniref:Uncharacterized protein n=1 Tax=Streptomyces brasiliscabiei TaxID=2736302 RepID=A0ABU8G3P1_9ACTN
MSGEGDQGGQRGELDGGSGEVGGGGDHSAFEPVSFQHIVDDPAAAV